MHQSITIKEFYAMPFDLLKRRFLRWYWTRVENHAAISAGVEREKQRQALFNARHYEEVAVVARSNKNMF